MTSDAGIYEVLNVMDGRSYIGSSVRLDVRLTQHRCALESGNHSNRFLQRAWNKAEWRENMSAALKGRKHSPEAIEKMAAARRAYWAARR